MQTITMYQGDLLPLLEIELTDRQNIPLNLSTAVEVKLYMGLDPAIPADNKINGAACEIVDAANGKAVYAWQPGDTAEAGDYFAEIVVIFAENKPQTAGQFTIRVVDSLHL